MTTLREFLDRLPIDDALLRAVPVSARHETCVLELDLGRGLGEAPADSPLAALRARHRPTLSHVVTALRRGVDDRKVWGLVVHCGGPGLGLSSAEEVADAITAFRAAGKPTLAWAETYGELTSGMAAYVVASACDDVWVQPSGQVGLVGAVAEVPFVRDALDKADLQPQFGQRREYKTAAETFMAHEMSGPHREMLTRIVESHVETVVGRVSAARAVGREDVRSAIDAAPLAPSTARELRLVDHIGYRHDVYAAMFQRVGRGGDDDRAPELRFVERYRRAASSVASLAVSKRPEIAVVRLQGRIHLGRSGAGGPFGGRTCGSDTIGALLRLAGRSDKVAAVVLRIDSPGGSYVASDAIRAEVHALRESGTPVVASMASVAASGGYFAAMGCNEIVSNASTLTGSIGVLAGKVTTEGGLRRLGVRRELVQCGAQAGMFSSQRGFDADQWARLDAWLDEVYADFTQKAAHDRGMDVAELERVARGRVWTGSDALRRGLVDHLGGLQVGIERACALAGLSAADVQVKELPKIGPLDRLTPADNSDAPVSVWTGEGLATFDGLVAALGLSPRGVLTMPDLTIR